MYKIYFLVAFILIGVFAKAQPDYTELQIPMRDGKFLAADLYLPDSANMPFPVILIQTPYNKNLYRFSLPLNIGWNQSNSNYAIVFADWRCYYASTSACIAQPKRGEDGYDAVEWIAAQTWSTGKVGTYGPSALGQIQYLTAAEKPPHLYCIAPEVASPQDFYDKYYPNGVARYELINALGNLFGLDQLYGAHPYYDFTWQFLENNSYYADEIEVPTLILGGWYDINCDENWIIYQQLLDESMPVEKVKIVIGPWAHGGSSFAGGFGDSIQGELNYANAAFYNRTMALDFFDYYLRDIPNQWESKSPITYYQMGENEWQTTNQWPVNDIEWIDFYCQDNHLLKENLPENTIDSESFLYNPHNPQPTIGGQNLSIEQGPYNQVNDVENRTDNIIFSTEILTKPLHIKGKIKAKFYVSSDQLDTDFILTLTDVYPDGSSMKIAEQGQRMRYLNGRDAASIQFLNNDEVYEVDIEFQNIAISIKENHQLRLIVSSSSYPFFNRNMNNGLEMYPNVNLDTLYNTNIAENTFYFNANYPSKLSLPLVDYTVGILSISQDLVTVYPNPSQDVLHLNSAYQMESVCLVNYIGQKQNIDFYQNKIDITSLPKGIYILEIHFLNDQKQRTKIEKR